ncbi:MAG: hypothetical protein JNJ56_10205 [Ignavibacteria bacterium]|nr:hypothetical protein [Ignavibacteria bacterium]
MKSILIILMLLYAGNLFSQIKQRSSGTSAYLGVGYKFVFLTNSAAQDAYPFFQLSNGDFLKEIDGMLGVSFNDKVAVEFSPAYLFTNASSGEGYYYKYQNTNFFYYPVYTNLFALPLNLRIKFFPFSNGTSDMLKKVYIGAGGGAMYIDEQITNQVYSENSRINYLGTYTYKNDFWTPDYEILLGINSFSKIGFGFELSYRFVPLNQSRVNPIISSVADNFNSINFTANIIYSFDN